MLRVGPETKVGNQIIAVLDQTAADREQLINKYHLTAEFLRYANDPLERARVEYNSFTSTWLVVFNAPVVANDTDKRVVKPVSFVLKSNQLFVFITAQTQYVDDAVTAVNKADETRGMWDSLFAILYQITMTYFDHIQQMTEVRLSIEEHLHQHSSSKRIFELADLSTNLTYFLTGANSNLVTIDQLRLLARRGEELALSKQSLAQLEDVEVEVRQAQEMLELNSDIVDKLSNTYNNLLNNNLNQVMKLLTVYSVVLMIPPIIFGFYGMNMFLPLADKQWSWIFSVVISVAPIIWVMYRLKHDHFI